MAAIGEPARGHELLDLPEGFADGLVGIEKRQCPQTRGIDEQRSAGQAHELSGNSRVAAFPVAPELTGCEVDRTAPEAVGKGGLAGAGRPDENDRGPWLKKGTHDVHAFAGNRADGDDVTAADQPLGGLDGARDVFGEVRLGQDRDGCGATLPGQNQETLQPPRAETAL